MQQALLLAAARAHSLGFDTRFVLDDDAHIRSVSIYHTANRLVLTFALTGKATITVTDHLSPYQSFQTHHGLRDLHKTLDKMAERVTRL